MTFQTPCLTLCPTKPLKFWLAGRPDLAVLGGLAIAVPLELRGLALAHSRHGSLSWARLVAPVVPYARDGFPAHPYLVAALASPITLGRCCAARTQQIAALAPIRPHTYVIQP